MDHVHVKSIGLFLILVNSFSELPKTVKVQDSKTCMVKQILRVIFSSNGLSKLSVSNNAPEFCDESLCLK